MTSNSATRTTLLTRTDGIDYYDFARLDVDLGSGGDIVNVHGTSSTTNIRTHDGPDQIMVSSNAFNDLVDQDSAMGHLDWIQGPLNLDAGADLQNALFVSDHDAASGNNNVTITDSTIDGLAPARITYAATGGAFDAGLSIWTSQLADGVDVTSVDVGSQTITTVYTGSGDDNVRVEVADDLANPSHAALASIDRRLKVRTLDGEDVVDASRSNLAVRVESGSDADIVTTAVICPTTLASSSKPVAATMRLGAPIGCRSAVEQT